MFKEKNKLQTCAEFMKRMTLHTKMFLKLQKVTNSGGECD